IPTGAFCFSQARREGPLEKSGTAPDFSGEAPRILRRKIRRPKVRKPARADLCWAFFARKSAAKRPIFLVGLFYCANKFRRGKFRGNSPTDLRRMNARMNGR